MYDLPPAAQFKQTAPEGPSILVLAIKERLGRYPNKTAQQLLARPIVFKGEPIGTPNELYETDKDYQQFVAERLEYCHQHNFTPAHAVNIIRLYMPKQHNIDEGFVAL